MPDDELNEIFELHGKAHAIHDSLRLELGSSYAGAWFDEKARTLRVGVVDPLLKEPIRQAGADPVLHDASLAELREIVERLIAGALANGWMEKLSGGYIDYESNEVRIQVLDWDDSRKATLGNNLKRIDLEADKVRLEPSIGRAKLLSDVRGGDAFHNTVENRPCSVGFSVDGGFITAGHCGWDNHQVNADGGQPLGAFSASTWLPAIYSEPGMDPFVLPTRDLGLVNTFSGWNPIGEVNPYSGLSPILSGSTDGWVGGYVCRYGQTTGGPHCGQIQSLDAFVVVFEPVIGMPVPVVDLILVDNCGDVGDSGGPLIQIISPIWHARALGLTVASNQPGCPGGSGGHVYYSFVNHALSLFDVDLL